jgi:hypothetical protein
MMMMMMIMVVSTAVVFEDNYVYVFFSDQPRGLVDRVSDY